MCGNLQKKKNSSALFVSILSGVILLIYITGIAVPWFIYFNPNAGNVVYLIFFHFFAAMFIWSFAAVVATEPGKVPVSWGFYLDDPENKKRKYCLICHIFKPERCHHCSTCKKCVLNMDHHCPWINNCIGFGNRKIFILMLFYLLCTLFMLELGLLKAMIFSFQRVVSNGHGKSLRHSVWVDLSVLFAFVSSFVLFIMISIFFKFHIKLILTNLTTIENLEVNRMGNEEEKKSVKLLLIKDYDLGMYYNWIQVFGQQKRMWWLPFFTEDSLPMGDGIIWPKSVSQMEQFAIEEASKLNSERKKDQGPLLLILEKFPPAYNTPFDPLESQDKFSFNIKSNVE